MITTNCQLCGYGKLVPIIDLGFHPLADTFLPINALTEPEDTFPLKVLLCPACGYATLQYIVDAPSRYQKKDYSYTSSNSAVSLRHFREIAQEITTELKINSSDQVLDIGSNDGTLLQNFREIANCQIMGVEPSTNILKMAKKNNIPTIHGFFDKGIKEQILKSGQVKAITANNVFNHITNLTEFVQNICDLLSIDGAFIFEVPYLLDLVEMNAFDTIYLEHVSYFALKPLEQFFEKYNLQIFRIERTEYMGGTIRVYVGKNRKKTITVFDQIRKEIDAKIYEPATYESLMKKIQEFKFNLCHQIYEIKSRGEKIIGIGAPTKGNTLLNYCGLDGSMLEFITDSSPLKINKFTPGSHILIKNDSDITPNIKYGLILPWNIGDFLVKKLQHLNLNFIIPKMKN